MNYLLLSMLALTSFAATKTMQPTPTQAQTASQHANADSEMEEWVSFDPIPNAQATAQKEMEETLNLFSTDTSRKRDHHTKTHSQDLYPSEATHLSGEQLATLHATALQTQHQLVEAQHVAHAASQVVTLEKLHSDALHAQQVARAAKEAKIAMIREMLATARTSEQQLERAIQVFQQALPAHKIPSPNQLTKTTHEPTKTPRQGHERSDIVPIKSPEKNGSMINPTSIILCLTLGFMVFKN